MPYEWTFSVVSPYCEAFLRGVLLTLEVSVIAFGVGLSIAVPLGFCRRSPFRIVSVIAGAYVELARSLPVLVLIVWIYYCLPIVLDVRVSAFATTVLALALSSAAYGAEIIRAGTRSVPTGQLEAGYAAGYSRLQVALHIVTPQAIRAMVAPLVGLFIATVKNSALASFIAVPELLHTANDVISATFRPLEIYTTVAGIYIVVLLPLSLLSKRLEAEVQYS